MNHVSNSISTSDIAAVIVSFNPDPELIELAFRAVDAQVGRTLVVDNGSNHSVRKHLQALCRSTRGVLLQQEENVGIASAHNLGMERARLEGYSRVILLDHDSIVTEGVVQRLLDGMNRLKASGVQLAAVAPVFFDERMSDADPYPFRRLEGTRIRYVSCNEAIDGRFVETDYAISSGLLLDLDAVEQIGGMLDGFIIDYVDIEWGLRARKQGFRIFGVCDAVLKHRLGDQFVKIPFMPGRRAPVRSPERHYYLFRNGILMMSLPHVPLLWKVGECWRILLRFLFYATITPPRWGHFRMMSLGILDGLRGRMGINKATTQ